MRGFLTRGMDAIREQMESWGLRMPSAKQGVDSGTRLLVFEPRPEGLVHVGTLSEENGKFTFRYSLHFASTPGAAPIADFPELDRTYTSGELFPFFAIRLPPTGRSDVKEALRSSGLEPEQTLHVLGKLGHLSVANSYRLRLAENAR